MGTLLLFLAGCPFNPPDGGAPGGDAAVDGSISTPLCEEWQTKPKHIGDPCRVYPPEGEQWTVAEDVELNTTACVGTAGDAARSYTATQPAVPQELCVFSVASFTLPEGKKLRAIGNRALLIVSQSTIVIAGTIDVSSNRTGGLGAGARTMGCNAARDGDDDPIGGGGGGFGQAGGDGGNTPGGGSPPGEGGGSISPPKVVLAGCAGSNGGEDNPTAGGDAAEGGGAVQLTAKTSIVIAATGSVNAGGKGGGGGRDGGGGGGGSGGYIGLDAPQIEVIAGAQLAANGGGGGTGCNDSATRGAAGSDGALGPAAALGGPSSGCFEAAGGGSGGALASGSTVGLQNPNSGGGGGGGVGFILYWGTLAGGVDTSPMIVAGPAIP